MVTSINTQTSWTISFLIAIFSLSLPAYAQYSGGTGETNDPYQIATADDLILLGESPDDYDKHFILTDDVNLAPDLPGRKVFDRAIIAPDTNDVDWDFQGTSFTGSFDGNGHTISYLTIAGKEYLGLFGQLGSGARISNLGLEAVDVNGTSGYGVGGLVGENNGSITTCYSTGMVSGSWYVGGLVGENNGNLSNSYSTGTVSGLNYVGGLVGENNGIITTCYSTSTVTGYLVGDLVGWNYGSITTSFWDMDKSSVSENYGVIGLTTAEMMDPNMLGLNGLGGNPNWVVDAGRDYPRLTWEGTPGEPISEPDIDWFKGSGTDEDPYCIETYEQLIMPRIRRASILWERHFLLCVDIDLDPKLPGRDVFSQAVIPSFSGLFDGNGHVISNLWINGSSYYLGLFERLESGATVINLGLTHLNVTGTAFVGGLVGINKGSVSNCYSTGTVTGINYVGGLVGENNGGITMSYSTGTVGGSYYGGSNFIGGLVGENNGSITTSYSTGPALGSKDIGGLVGYNRGSVSNCYSTGAVTGDDYLGGLVGSNNHFYINDYYQYVADDNGGVLINSYSTGLVSYRASWYNAGSRVSGLVGGSLIDSVSNCFWDKDKQQSFLSDNRCGSDISTAEMYTQSTFTAAGWDFVGEIDNGIEDIWFIPDSNYPRLNWERTVWFPDYMPLDPNIHGIKTFEWVYGKSGEYISRIGESEIVPYLSGPIPGVQITNHVYWGTFLVANDGQTVKFLGSDDWFLSTDPTQLVHPAEFSFAALHDGMIVDPGLFYYLPKDLSPPDSDEDIMLLVDIQDVTVGEDSYYNSIIIWWLDAKYPFTPLDLYGKESDLGITLLSSSDADGYSVTEFEIYALGTGLIAFGGVNAETGSLHDLAVLKQVE